jgi:DNA-binding transcriptional LysR family regulator
VTGIVDEWLLSLGRMRHVALRVPHFLVAVHVVATSDLVLTLPARMAAALADGHGVRVVEPPGPIPKKTLWQIWHERRRHDPAHTWLRELVASEFQGHSITPQ